ncbi:AraC family transcriptional regulator [Kibdelosporangium aridum]|uniref:AraC family transcriptional regulator n=1 Tax=Kibdelosporangium aridum TaxID=2030 RepID=A0A428ZJ02_KIBAR|nr:AraC family transcriptional regulator [Kibdelosporangium aridum]
MPKTTTCAAGSTARSTSSAPCRPRRRKGGAGSLGEVFDSPDFDLEPYAAVDADRYVRRTFCSWDGLGWKSLLVQRFEHVAQVEEMALPATADVHLVMTVAGRTEMETRTAGRWERRRWTPGKLDMTVPGQDAQRRYRAAGPFRTLQVHISHTTVDRVAGQLSGRATDFEQMAASIAAGDPVVEHTLRSLETSHAVDDLYAESAAVFLTAHLLTHHGGRADVPGPNDDQRRVRKAVAVMRERLAEPVTLADIAAEVGLSVYHFIRVFKAATGQTPHKYLTGLRIDEARRLLRDDALSLDRIAARCGFGSAGSLSTTFLRHTGVRPSAYRNS